jgi:hypothetical protein
MEGEFGDQLIVVEHHVNDVFENAFSLERKDLYSAGYLPQVWFDGLYVEGGASSCSSAASEYRGWITKRLAECGGESPIAIDGRYWPDGDSLRMWAAFTRESADTIIAPRAYLVVYEDDLVWNGEHYDRASRAGCSEAIELPVIGGTVLVDATLPIDSEWDLSHIGCFAFLQRGEDPREVYQAGRLGLGSVAAGVPAGPLPRIVSLGPNPYRPGAPGGALRARIEPAGDRPARFAEILDARGRSLRRWPVAGSESGTLVLSWDGRDGRGRPLPGGVFWFRVGDARPAALVVVP